jgi:hypothetical protein
MKSLSNCPGLSEAHQIDFIEKIDAPDLPPNDVYIPERDPLFYSEVLTPDPG